MALRDLVPWRRAGSRLPVRQGGDVFRALHEDMDRLFGRFLTDWDGDWLPAWQPLEGAFAPRVDVSEDDGAIHVRAELPGLDEKDIEVSLEGDRLVIQGERKEEHEEKDKRFYRRESSYGMFRRDIPLPAEVEMDKAEAEFKRGVLHVTLPKTATAQSQRKQIEVRSA